GRAATDAFGIDMSVFPRNADLRERADDSAGCSTGQDACAGRDQPACGHNGSDPGDGKHAEAREQARRSAKHRTDAGADFGVFSASATVAVYPAVSLDAPILRDDADILRRQPGAFEIAHDLSCGFVIIVET